MQRRHRLSHWRFAWRVLRLLLRGFGALLAILLALLLALYLALPYVLNGERVKAALVGQLEALLRRPVSVERVIVTLHGIKLARLRVLDPGGRKSFIEADSALATVRLPALLHKRLELSHVRLASPRIYIRRDALGYWNFSDLLTSSARAGPAPGAFGVLADISVDQTDIEDGSLEVDDRLRGKRYSIDRYNLSVRKFELEAPFEFSLSLDKVNAFGRRRFSSSLALRGTMSLAGLDWPKAFIDARQAHLEVDGRSLTGSVRISSFTAPALEARVGVPALGSADWQWLFGRPMAFSLPASRWTARARWSDPGQVQVETIRVEAGSLGARASGLLDVSGPRPLLSAEADFQDFPLEAASGLRPALAAYHLTGTASGELALAGQPGRWNVSRAHLRLRGAGARSRHWSLTDGDADVTATRNFADLAVTLSSGAFEAYHNHFGDAALSLRLVRRDLRIDYLSLKWEDSRLRLRGRVVNLPAPRKIWLSGSLDRLHWERAQRLVADVAASLSTRTAPSPQPQEEISQPRQLWVQAFKYSIPKRFPDTAGHIRIGKVLHKNFSFANVDLLWDLRGITNTLATASGDLRASFGSGRVNDIPAVQESNKFLRIVFLPYIYMHKMNNLSVLSAATAFPKTLDFNRIEGQYGVSHGVVTTRFFYVDSPQFLAFAEGTADFGREKVDMNILTRLTSYRAPLPEWWVDEAGRPAIGFRVEGDLNSPDIEPRLKKMGAHEIEQRLEEARRLAAGRLTVWDKPARSKVQRAGGGHQ